MGIKFCGLKTMDMFMDTQFRGFLILEKKVTF